VRIRKRSCQAHRELEVRFTAASSSRGELRIVNYSSLRTIARVAAFVLATLTGAFTTFVSVAGIYDLTVAAGVSTVDHPDYVWVPLSISSGKRALITLVATLGVVTCVLVLQTRVRRRQAPRSSVALAAVTCALGAYAGLLYAVATEPVVGANIGFGLMVIGALPYTCVTLLVGLWIARPAGRSKDRPGRSA
jgi:drug/metabolite transporter (DMT)-like permease